MIKALAQSQKWQDALHCLDWPFSSNDVAKKTTVLSACSRASQWALLCLLADPKRQSQIVLPNVAINAFGERWQISCDVFASLGISSLKPDKISFQSTLSSCLKAQQWTVSLDLHKDKASVQSSAAYNVIVRSCAQEQWRSAVAILHEFQLRRLFEQRHRNDAFDSDKTEASLLTSAISSCERAAWQLVFRCWDGHVRSDAVMFTSAMKVAPWHVSQMILTRMRLLEVTPDRFSVAAVLKSDGPSNAWEHAVQHLSCSLSFKLTLDVAAYNAAMIACAAYGAWWCVFRLLKLMRASKIRADRISYDAMVTSLTNQPWEEVLLVLASMHSHGMTPGLKSLSVTWSSAMKVFDKVKSLPWCHALNHVHGYVHWQMAFDAFDDRLPERDDLVHEACRFKGWQWTVSALSFATTRGRGNRATKAKVVLGADRLAASTLVSLASAFTVGNIWESAFMCIEELRQLGSSKASDKVMSSCPPMHHNCCIFAVGFTPRIDVRPTGLKLADC